MKLLLLVFLAVPFVVHGQNEKAWKRKMLQSPKQCMSFMNQAGYGMTSCAECRCSCSPPNSFCFQDIKKRNGAPTVCKNTPSQCVSAMKSGGGGGGGGGGRVVTTRRPSVVRTTTRRPAVRTTTRRPQTTTRRTAVRTTTRASGGSSDSCTKGSVARGGARFFRGRCYVSRSSCRSGCYANKAACEKCNNLGGAGGQTTRRPSSGGSCPKGGSWKSFGSRCFRMSRGCSGVCYADQATCLKCKGN